MKAMDDLAGVTAAILAGGLGTRLSAVVADRPKVLAPVAGRPFLAYLLGQLARAGLTQVVLCTGYLGEQVQAALGETFQGLKLTYSKEPTPLGTGGALWLALPHFKSETVLVLNGDSYCEVDLRALWAWHAARGAQGTLVLAKKRHTARYGRVEAAPDDSIKNFVEKGGQGGPGWINAGIYLLSRLLLQTVPANRLVSLEQEMFPAWVGRGLFGYKTGGRFLDIGTPRAYGRAPGFFAPKRGRDPGPA